MSWSAPEGQRLHPEDIEIIVRRVAREIQAPSSCELLTKTQAAALLGVSEHTIARLVRKGEISKVSIADGRFRRAAIEKFIQSREE